VRESYEELLWWLLMPSLLRLAGEPVPDRGVIETMGRTVEEALASAEAAGYRIDKLPEPETAAPPETIKAEGEGADESEIEPEPLASEPKPVEVETESATDDAVNEPAETVNPQTEEADGKTE
jgi:hypothetical protein